jgi:hypothetical protein
MRKVRTPTRTVLPNGKVFPVYRGEQIVPQKTDFLLKWRGLGKSSLTEASEGKGEKVR